MRYCLVDGREHLILRKCKGCGAHGQPQHLRHPNLCIECGRKYDTYKSRRSIRRREGLSPKVMEDHVRILKEYVKLREAGFVVPPTLDSEIFEADVILI